MAVGPEKVTTVVAVVEGLNAVILKMIDYIMLYAPWGVLALILKMDRPLDKLCTVVNVTGDATVLCLVEAGETKAN